jgi:hypothetical protein
MSRDDINLDKLNSLFVMVSAYVCTQWLSLQMCESVVIISHPMSKARN